MSTRSRSGGPFFGGRFIFQGMQQPPLPSPTKNYRTYADRAVNSLSKTFSAIVAADVPTGTSYIRTTGFNNSGSGAAVYEVVSSAPSAAKHTVDITYKALGDGRYLVLLPQDLNFSHFGCVGGDSNASAPDDSAGLQAAANWSRFGGHMVMGGPKKYYAATKDIVLWQESGTVRGGGWWCPVREGVTLVCNFLGFGRSLLNYTEFYDLLDGGSFDDGTWTVGTNWTATANAITHTAGAANAVSKSYNFADGDDYLLGIRINSITAGQVRISLMNTSTYNVLSTTYRTTAGQPYYEVVAPASLYDLLVIQPSSDFVGEVAFPTVRRLPYQKFNGNVALSGFRFEHRSTSTGPNPFFLDVGGAGESHWDKLLFGGAKGPAARFRSIGNSRGEIAAYGSGLHFPYLDTDAVTVSINSGATTLNATAGTPFTLANDVVGRTIVVANANGSDKFVISARTGDTQVTVNKPASRSYTDATIQFDHIRGSMSLGSDLLVAEKASFTADYHELLPITVPGAGASGKPLTAFVLEVQSGTTVKLSKAAETAATDEYFFASSVSFNYADKYGAYADPDQAKIDDIDFVVHVENPRGVGLFADNCTAATFKTSKTHGEAQPVYAGSTLYNAWFNDFRGMYDGLIHAAQSLGAGSRVVASGICSPLRFGDLELALSAYDAVVQTRNLDTDAQVIFDGQIKVLGTVNTATRDNLFIDQELIDKKVVVRGKVTFSGMALANFIPTWRYATDWPLRDKVYTVATLPASAPQGCEVFVSDEIGGATPAFGDGTNWRRVTDRAIVS